jgi:hypothetical protein
MPQRYEAMVVSIGDAAATARLIRERGNFDFSVGAVRRMKQGTLISSGLSADRAASMRESLEQVGTVIEVVPETAK